MEKYSLLLVKHKTGYAEPEGILKFKGFEVVKKDISKNKSIEAFIDKIENDIAEIHLYNGQTINIEMMFLPDGIKEGSFIDINFIFNNNKTKQIKENVKDLIQELSNNQA